MLQYNMQLKQSLFYVARNLKQIQVTQSDKFKQYADDSTINLL